MCSVKKIIVALLLVFLNTKCPPLLRIGVHRTIIVPKNRTRAKRIESGLINTPYCVTKRRDNIHRMSLQCADTYKDRRIAPCDQKEPRGGLLARSHLPSLQVPRQFEQHMQHKIWNSLSPPWVENQDDRKGRERLQRILEIVSGRYYRKVTPFKIIELMMLGTLEFLLDRAALAEILDNRLVSSSSALAPDLTLPYSKESEKDAGRRRRLEDVLKDLFEEHPDIPPALIYAAMAEGLATIDRYTNIFPPAAVITRKEKQSGEYVGLGIGVGLGIKIEEVYDGTPASSSGVRVGDTITFIGDVPTSDMTPADASRLLRGTSEKDTTISLTIKRDGELHPVSITVELDMIRKPFVKAELRGDIESKRIGYMRITSFGEPTIKEIKEKLPDLIRQNDGKPLMGLVLDLQGNPGGSLYQSIGVADLFLNGRPYFHIDSCTDMRARGTVMLSIYSRGERTEVYCAIWTTDILDGLPLVVLIDGGSASAAELVAAALQTHKRAVIVGEPSFGKGSVQTEFPLDDKVGGGLLVLTTSQYAVGPYGCQTPIQQTGVKPDILLKLKGKVYWQEADLEGAPEALVVSNDDCQKRKVSPEDLKIARVMLRELGLLPPIANAQSEK